MEQALAKQLVERRNRLASERTLWDEQWQEVNTFIIPRKANINVSRTTGEKVAQEKFSSVAGHAHEILSANLQGTLTSKSFRWFDLESPQLPDAAEDRMLREWLDDVATELWRSFNRSNFHSQSHEMYLDVTATGTACLLLEEKEGPANQFNGFVCTSHATGSYFIEEDYEGVVNAICLDINISAVQAFGWFGDAVSEKIMKDLDDDPNTMHKFIHWVLPREDRNSDKIDSKNKAYASVFIEIQTNGVVKESGYDEFPYLVPRWSKVSGEKYGRGPGTMALPDIKVLDKATELELSAWAKAIDPPYKAMDDGVVGDVDLRPNGVTIVRDMNDIQVMESGARWDVNRIKLEEYRSSIRQTFFADQLELPASGPQMTATEVQARFELMNRVLGPTLGRIETEFLNRLIDRAFKIMARKDALPEPPDGIDIGAIDVNYVGPLARAQRSSEVQVTQQWLEIVAGIAQLDPQVLDNVNADAITHEMGQWLNVPTKFLLDQKQVDGIRKQRAERAQAEQKAAQQQQQAQTMGTMAGAAASMEGGGQAQ